MTHHNHLISQASECLAKSRRPGQHINRVLALMTEREALFRLAGVETQITEASRTVRVKTYGDWGWEDRPCFKFTDADGEVSYADGLSEEQQDIFARQEVERGSGRSALAEIADEIMKDAELNALVNRAGF